MPPSAPDHPVPAEGPPPATGTPDPAAPVAGPAAPTAGPAVAPAGPDLPDAPAAPDAVADVPDIPAEVPVASADGMALWPTDVTWRPVSPKLRTARRIGLLGAAVPFLAGIGATVWWAPAWVPWSIGLVGVVSLGWSWVVIGRAVRSWGYAEREDDLLVRHGVLVRRLSVVPYGRMQFVDVTAGPLDRSLGIATVQLHTAAAASDAAIPGLVPAEAARLRDRLAALGEARAAGL